MKVPIKLALRVYSEYICNETEDRTVPPEYIRNQGQCTKEFASQFDWKRKYIGCAGIISKEEIKNQFEKLFFNHKHNTEDVILCEAFWIPSKNKTIICYYYIPINNNQQKQ